MMTHDVAFGEVEKRVVLQQRVLEMVGLVGRNSDVGSNSAAAVHGAAAIGELHLAVGGIRGLGIAVVVVVVKRNVAVIALDQTAARSVVVCRCQRQTGVFRQRIDGLNQAFAE